MSVAVPTRKQEVDPTEHGMVGSYIRAALESEKLEFLTSPKRGSAFEKSPQNHTPSR